MHKICLVFRLLNFMSQTKSGSTQHWSSETVTDWSSNSYLEKLTCHYIALDSCQMKIMGCCMSVDGFYCCRPKGQLRADLDLINDTFVSSIVRANYCAESLMLLISDGPENRKFSQPLKGNRKTDWRPRFLGKGLRWTGKHTCKKTKIHLS